MQETYPTQRSSITASNRNLVNITTERPFLKEATSLIQHSDRLIGKDVKAVWKSFIETKVQPLRRFLKTQSYKGEQKTVLTTMFDDCKAVCATTMRYSKNFSYI